MRSVENQGDFDPSDPYDAMCESFRIQIADMASNAYRAAIYREMTPEQQLSSFMGGVLTGLIGACFVSIRDEVREVMMECISEALPIARKHAEDIIEESLKTAQRKQE